jgi:O-antigen/teichoic acid export membrane protein
MYSPLNYLRKYVNKGHSRSQNIKKNVLLSFLIKGGSIIVTFLLVPLTLNYLGARDYGIWLTLSSVIAWFGFFDIGLGNGLRNRFAEALAVGDKALARVYVSTTYFGLAGIFGILWILFVGASFFLNWNIIFNISENKTENLQLLVVYVFTLFILRFILRLIAIIITADQKPALSNTFDPLSNVISLIIIYVLTITTKGSLMYLAMAVTFSPVFVLLLATFYFFSHRYKEYRPSIKYFRLDQLKDLTGLGFQFFIIQIAVLVIFSTDNMIITQILGPAAVTPYNIAFKYFNSIAMAFAIIMNPLWSAYTQAYTVNDIPWIKQITRQLIKIWFGVAALVLIMILISGYFYHFWIGDKVIIPITITVFMGIFILISTWDNIFVYFINGTGKIRFQLYSSIVVAVINIPLSIFLAKNMNLGAAGVIMATCICLFPGVILAPYQYKKLLNKTARGIWNK